jgi:hypothetical protein
VSNGQVGWSFQEKHRALRMTGPHIFTQTTTIGQVLHVPVNHGDFDPIRGSWLQEALTVCQPGAKVANDVVGAFHMTILNSTNAASALINCRIGRAARSQCTLQENARCSGCRSAYYPATTWRTINDSSLKYWNSSTVQSH